MQEYPQNRQNPQQSYAPGNQPSFQQNAPQSYVPNTPSYSQGGQAQFPQNVQTPYPQNGQQLPPQNMQGQGQGQKYQYNFDEKKMRRYFYPPANVFMWIFGIGVVLLLLGILIASVPYVGALGIPFILWGLVLGAIGGIPLLIHYTQRPTPSQYEGWVYERSQPLYDIALKRLHLDISQCKSIIEVQGGISSLIRLTKKFPEKEIVVKRLPDGFRHYSINTCIYIFLLEDAIAIYSGYINALGQRERFEDAERYYYKDIVAVSTSGPVFLVGDDASTKEVQRQGFLVRANNGDIVGTDYATRVIARGDGRRRQLEGVDEVVPALLHFVQDHKAAPDLPSPI